MAKRLNEFQTYSTNDCGVLYLYAIAEYKRGDIPDIGEFEYISKRVMDKFPNAEFIKMERNFVPVINEKPVKVRWKFEWAVYDYKKDNEVK